MSFSVAEALRWLERIAYHSCEWVHTAEGFQCVHGVTVTDDEVDVGMNGGPAGTTAMRGHLHLAHLGLGTPKEV